MVNPAGKIERLMVHKPKERFMVYDLPLCVIIAPSEDDSLRMEAFGGEELQQQALDEKILHDPTSNHTDFIWFLCKPIIERELGNGSDIPKLLYPEVGIEYAYALRSQRRVDYKSFSIMLGLCRGLQFARNFELGIPEKENPLPYERRI